jgi:signal transduction histidine kinase
LLFQTVRELLFNVVKHADISQARVTLKSIEEGTTITVKDGGKGFDTDTVLAEDGDGFGLRNLRERLLLFGGSATITSAPGEGTYILLFLPHFIVDSEIGELLTPI